MNEKRLLDGRRFTLNFHLSLSPFTFQSNNVGWSLSIFLRIAFMRVSRMRRLRFATLYRSQKRSSARSSLSLSMIDILKSRGCFFTGGEGLWVTGYGLAVRGGVRSRKRVSHLHKRGFGRFFLRKEDHRRIG